MKKIKHLVLISLIFLSNKALADDGFNIDNLINVSGDLRSYYFERGFSNAPSEHTYSFGGAINLETAPIFKYFQIETTFYTAQPLGLNSSNPLRYDATLPGKAVNALGQAFAQFKNDNLLIRAGNQLIDTPWLGPSDSRMIPATYQGLFSTYAINDYWTLTALRTIGFKSRTNNSFASVNLYNPEIIGGTPIPALGKTTDNGALAFASTVKIKDLNSEIWYYQFYDFARMLYNNNTYTLKTSTIFNPVFGLQLLRENSTGNNLIQQTTGKGPDASAFGALAGVENNYIRATVAYNKIFAEDNAFHNGDIVSPYTTGYATDPLYTTQMLAGLIEKAPGDAVKFALTFFAFNHQLNITPSFAKYYTNPQMPDSSEGNLDIQYKFVGVLKGLSIRDRTSILNSNDPRGRQVNTRLMLQYSF